MYNLSLPVVKMIRTCIELHKQTTAVLVALGTDIIVDSLRGGLHVAHCRAISRQRQ